jgi:hypothetical protein
MATRTDAQLTTDANVIKNETAPGANTATRVGNMLVDAIDSKVNIDKIASPTVVGTTKLYNDLAASNTDGAVTQAALVTEFALKADKVQTAWTDILLNSDWEKYPTGQTPQWRVDQFGKIELRGEVRTKTATGSSQFISPAIAGRALAANRIVIFLKPYTGFGGGGYSGNAAVSLESDGSITIAKSPFPTWSGATIDVGNLSLEGMVAWP